MADQDLNAELHELREQLEKLQRQHDEAGSAETEQAAPTAEPDSESSFDTILSELNSGTFDLAGQVRELLESLDKDIRDTKPSTLLIVFALGVLVGRLR